MTPTRIFPLSTLFDDDATAPETAVHYCPVWEDLHSVTEARERIVRILAASGEGREGEPLTLDHFLPEAAVEPDEASTPRQAPLLRASAWATTFSAGLELAKQGEVAIAQEGAFEAVSLMSRAAGADGTSRAVER